MAGGNVDILRRFYELWNGGAPAETLVDFMAADVEYVNPPYAVEPGTRHGPAGMLAALETLDATFDFYEHAAHEFVDLGARVLCLTTFRARGRGGVEYATFEAHLWTLREGKITRFEWFHDRAEAFAAADLEE